MAVYKVIQDVEAEDKLLGPLTFKGFIYMLIAGVLAFINFRLLLATDLGALRWLLIVLLALPMLLFAVLASPLGREQPTEVWLLSRIRFLLKPRRRLWDQSGIQELVTITAPKTVEKHLTKELSQSEVTSRLRALALTMDSRGWATKNKGVKSDRLTDAALTQKSRPEADVAAEDDILDEQNNPTAKKFDQLMKRKEEERKKDIAQRLKSAHERGGVIQKGVGRLPDREPPPSYVSSHFRHSEKNVKPAKLELAQSGSGLSVESIANLANRQPKARQVGPGEVVINLR